MSLFKPKRAPCVIPRLLLGFRAFGGAGFWFGRAGKPRVGWPKAPGATDASFRVLGFRVHGLGFRV